MVILTLSPYLHFLMESQLQALKTLSYTYGIKENTRRSLKLIMILSEVLLKFLDLDSLRAQMTKWLRSGLMKATSFTLSKDILLMYLLSVLLQLVRLSQEEMTVT